VGAYREDPVEAYPVEAYPVEAYPVEGLVAAAVVGPFVAAAVVVGPFVAVVIALAVALSAQEPPFVDHGSRVLRFSEIKSFQSPAL